MARFKKASDIRVATIGYGGAYNMGKAHLSEMKKAGMRPSAVVELDPKRLDIAAEDFPGIELYSSVSAMLKKSDTDLVAIITPHNTHAKLAIQCLRAGRSVVCEKPFAITTVECDAMIGEAKKRKLLVSTYHNRHWDGCIVDAMKAIRSGVIGDLVRVEAHMGGWGKPSPTWRGSKSISGGIMYDWGVHLLEYSLQAIDSDITEVTGFSRNGYWAPKTNWKKDTIEDEGCAVVRFKNGVWLTLSMSHLDHKGKDGMVEFTGTKGTYVMEYASHQIFTRKGNNAVVTNGPSRSSEGWRLYQNVADHLVKGARLIITPEWARRPIHILDLACQSAKQGKSLKPKYR